jgi:hypothetical protein
MDIEGGEPVTVVARLLPTNRLSDDSRDVESTLEALDCCPSTRSSLRGRLWGG